VRIFGFIAAKKAEHSIALMCRVLGVSRSGFHAWQARKPSARALEDERLTVRIPEIHERFRGVHGSPRIHAELVLADGERLGRKRVERLMRAAGISGLVRRRRGRTTIRVPGVRVCEDLVSLAFGRPRGRPGSSNRWEAAAIALTTRSPRASFATLKKELVNRRPWSQKAELRSEISSTTSRSSTTANDATARSACAPRRTSRPALSARPGPDLAASRLASPQTMRFTAPTIPAVASSTPVHRSGGTPIGRSGGVAGEVGVG
jgi:hypothetical protein